MTVHLQCLSRPTMTSSWHWTSLRSLRRPSPPSTTAVLQLCRRTLANAFLLLLVVGLTVAGSDSANFRKLKRDGHGPLLSNGTDTDNDDDEEDDDSDEDDLDEDTTDKDERVRNAIVGAVPAVLGLLAIIILCLFMLCGRRKTGQRSKWDARSHDHHPYLPGSSHNNISVTAEVDVDTDDDWSANFQIRQPEAAIVAVHSPAPSYEACVRQSQSVNDAPPSYEEVMRNKHMEVS